MASEERAGANRNIDASEGGDGDGSGRGDSAQQANRRSAMMMDNLPLLMPTTRVYP